MINIVTQGQILRNLAEVFQMHTDMHIEMNTESEMFYFQADKKQFLYTGQTDQSLTEIVNP